jgi:hypothetical protein
VRLLSTVLLLLQAMTTADGGACLAAYRLLATMRQGAGRQADAIKVLDKALGFKREEQVGGFGVVTRAFGVVTRALLVCRAVRGCMWDGLPCLCGMLH